MTPARVRSRRLGVTTVAAAIAIGLGGTATTATAAATSAATPSATGTAARTAAAKVDYETWKRDVKAVIDQARPYVEQRTQNPGGEKQAIVLDIDNTSLESDFKFAFPAPPVEPVLQLMKYAHTRGVDLFFVTARPDILTLPTQYNLETVGYPVAGLYVRSLPDLFDEVAAYKTAKRAEIEKKGYTIIANIGNSPTDLVGGHAEKTFKLPDYDGQLS
ncbi:HAD family acid phosphatase [Streptomyces sp. Rer75]|uniref:HAD family acid phosphatase n=1 Tax=Streptomyces sp. Rer75 TaxID=2750011 RepID=UPI0015D0C304|nr:HAD family acid phosphatase [Streptomyces sp. Rer75]QLH24056.1 hydrolase [Streptomyces sp. Rer75]